MIRVFEDKGQQLVDARELHGFLGVGKHFRTWIQDRIEKYGFTEGSDYVVLEGRPILGAPTPSKDYAIKPKTNIVTEENEYDSD